MPSLPSKLWTTQPLNRIKHDSTMPITDPHALHPTTQPPSTPAGNLADTVAECELYALFQQPAFRKLKVVRGPR